MTGQPTTTWMIYGANGYTGRQIVERAVADGARPVLAGRHRAEIESLAQRSGCPHRIFDLASSQAIVPELAGVSTVLLCAGPFSRTARPMMEACLQARVHYLDITGEWDVIEFASQQHQRALATGICIMPAVGFDVVPSDCLAKKLADALPTAHTLELAFTAISRMSPGTAKTMFSRIGDGGRARRDGRIVEVPVAWMVKEIPFASGTRTAVTIPWGDIASAFHSTNIPNIRVFSAFPRKQIRLMQRWRWLFPLARASWIQWLGRMWIDRNVRGPNEQEQSQGRAEFWGAVTDAEGQCVEANLQTPEGYALTVLTALAIVKKVAAGEVRPGFATPASAFGSTLIEQFQGVTFSWRNEH